jgi:hypothetical protein
MNPSEFAAKWSGSRRTERAQAEAERALPSRPHLDIEIHFPGAGLAPLRGRLEDAPRGPAVSIDPSAPPDWIDA